MRGLAGKGAVVVGGAGGIGTATCVRLAEEGGAVAVGDLEDERTLDAILATIRAPRVGRPEDIAAAVAFLVTVSTPAGPSATSRRCSAVPRAVLPA
ncbi:MAG TPA: SDR family NAD(P)-dependent oxidoreductase [Acidimicrobiales bacterium]|nr:SDR family NAD(P)-dependent oxidoreductase [Acidimicrobiales bacterium]